MARGRERAVGARRRTAARLRARRRLDRVRIAAERAARGRGGRRALPAAGGAARAPGQPRRDGRRAREGRAHARVDQRRGAHLRCRRTLRVRQPRGERAPRPGPRRRRGIAAARRAAHRVRRGGARAADARRARRLGGGGRHRRPHRARRAHARRARRDLDLRPDAVADGGERGGGLGLHPGAAGRQPGARVHRHPRAPRAPRLADRLLQPLLLRAPPAPAGRGPRRPDPPARAVLHRSRPVQDRQRHLRPRRRGPPAVRADRGARGEAPGLGRARPARRGRVRGDHLRRLGRAGAARRAEAARALPGGGVRARGERLPGARQHRAGRDRREEPRPEADHEGRRHRLLHGQGRRAQRARRVLRGRRVDGAAPRGDELAAGARARPGARRLRAADPAHRGGERGPWRRPRGAS